MSQNFVDFFSVPPVLTRMCIKCRAVKQIFDLEGTNLISSIMACEDSTVENPGDCFA